MLKSREGSKIPKKPRHEINRSTSMMAQSRQVSCKVGSEMMKALDSYTTGIHCRYYHGILIQVAKSLITDSQLSSLLPLNIISVFRSYTYDCTLDH